MTIRTTATLATLALLASPAAFADDWYYGVDAGLLSIDGDTESALQVGGTIGYDFTDSAFDFEVDVNTSLANGEVGPAEYSITQIAPYGVYKHRFQNDMYLKGKLGIAFHKESELVDDSDSNIAVGVGLGFARNFEVEYLFTEFENSDVNMLSLGYNF